MHPIRSAKEIERLEALSADLDCRIAILSQENEKLKESLLEKKGALTALEEANRHLIDEIRRSEREIASMSEKIALQQETSISEQKQLEEIDKWMERMVEAKKVYTSKIRDLKQELNDARRELGQLKKSRCELEEDDPSSSDDMQWFEPLSHG